MTRTYQEAEGGFTLTDTEPLPFERGRAIEWGWIQIGQDRGTGFTIMVKRDEVVQALKADAAESLPPGSRFELRERYATNYGRTRGMAWYCHEDFAKAEEWGDKTGPKTAGGYILVGQFTTPVQNGSPLSVAGGIQEIK